MAAKQKHLSWVEYCQAEDMCPCCVEGIRDESLCSMCEGTGTYPFEESIYAFDSATYSAIPAATLAGFLSRSLTTPAGVLRLLGRGLRVVVRRGRATVQGALRWLRSFRAHRMERRMVTEFFILVIIDPNQP